MENPINREITQGGIFATCATQFVWLFINFLNALIKHIVVIPKTAHNNCITFFWDSLSEKLNKDIIIPAISKANTMITKNQCFFICKFTCVFFSLSGERPYKPAPNAKKPISFSSPVSNSRPAKKRIAENAL